MWSGRKTFGKRTTFGSGKMGRRGGSIEDVRVQDADSSGQCRMVMAVHC
jgi:hypothetical protein